MKSPESRTHAQLVISPTDRPAGRPADNSNHCTSSPRHRARRCRIDESRPSTRESITCRAALRLTVRLNDDAELRPPERPPARVVNSFYDSVTIAGGSVAEWSACWTQAQYGPGSNRSRNGVG